MFVYISTHPASTLKSAAAALHYSLTHALQLQHIVSCLASEQPKNKKGSCVDHHDPQGLTSTLGGRPAPRVNK